MTVREPDASLMAKARRACASSRLLLSAGDIDGACNRAYYAMFDAARAALVAANVAFDSKVGKTHGGLIAAFGKHLVKTGQVSVEMGRLLNRAHEIRLVADYKGESVEHEDAVQMVGQAERFVLAIGEWITK